MKTVVGKQSRDMARIEWDESFSVQNDELDSQHKSLIRMYNELNASLICGSPEDAFHTKQMILDALIAYTLLHFATEEDYLRRIEFPEYDEHCQEHSFFSQKILNINKDIQSNKIILTTSLIRILRDWITEHLITKDQEFAQFARQLSTPL